MKRIKATKLIYGLLGIAGAAFLIIAPVRADDHRRVEELHQKVKVLDSWIEYDRTALQNPEVVQKPVVVQRLKKERADRITRHEKELSSLKAEIELLDRK